MKSEAEYFDFVDGPVPTCSHQWERQVGTESGNDFNAVPTVPIVPTAKSEDQDAQAAPDLDTFEERAAIIEHDGELPRQEAEPRQHRSRAMPTRTAFMVRLWTAGQPRSIA